MEFFLIQFAEKYRKFTMKFDSRTMRFAEEYEWPGNVRELQHAIERAVILTDGNTIKAEDVLPLSSLNQSSNTEQDLNLENMEVTSIQKALKQTGGNVARASDLLGITRSALYRRMEKYKL
jgi:DNA-binding NtrC family response regulator